MCLAINSNRWMNGCVCFAQRQLYDDDDDDAILLLSLEAQVWHEMGLRTIKWQIVWEL